MSDQNGTHKRLVEAKMRESELEAGRRQYLARVGNAQALAMRVLCVNPKDAVDVCVSMLASFAAGAGIPIENLHAALKRDFDEASAEVKQLRASEGKPPLVQPH
jgi:hypothetical protein